jgi:hypothetical protein
LPVQPPGQTPSLGENFTARRHVSAASSTIGRRFDNHRVLSQTQVFRRRRNVVNKQ